MNKFINLIIMVGVLSIFTLPSFAFTSKGNIDKVSTHPANKIAVVDVRSLLKPKLMAFMKDLKKKYDPQIKSDRSALMKMEQELKKNSVTMQQSAKAKMEARIKSKEEQIVSLAQEERSSFQKKMLEEGNKLQSFLASFSKKQGYDFILPKSSVVYVNPKMDITSEVKKKFD